MESRTKSHKRPKPLKLINRRRRRQVAWRARTGPGSIPMGRAPA